MTWHAGAIMKVNKLSEVSEQPPRADNALSKINTDYETGLCAAVASSIIHI
jgi:hypothetical protein